MMMDADSAFFVVGMALDIRPIALHLPDISGVAQLQVEQFPEQDSVLRGCDGGADLNPALQVAFHEIGGTDVIFLVTVVSEIKNTGVFEKSADQ
jgi:hypothetical protein